VLCTCTAIAAYASPWWCFVLTSRGCAVVCISSTSGKSNSPGVSSVRQQTHNRRQGYTKSACIVPERCRLLNHHWAEAAPKFLGWCSANWAADVL
jgi:hypothetical protein